MADSGSSVPFSLEHFREWARSVVLDTGEMWEVEPFQAAFLEDVFAGFPECWLIVPEGNTKTTTLAGLALYHCEFQLSAMVPVAAASREQAEIMYRQAEGMVLRSPRLAAMFKCQEGYRRIKTAAGSRIQVFAADDRTGDGLIPTLALLDELHRHQNLRLYRTWRGKLLKRKGQLATISTAGEPGSEFEETRERIRQMADDSVREGAFLRAVAGTVVLHEWAVPEDGDVEDMEVVKSANPFKGITVEALREKRDSPTMTLEHWRRFVCNLPTRSGFAAISEREWADAVSESVIPEGERVWVGIDLGWRWDTTAIVPFWWRDDDFRLFGRSRVLVPPRDGSDLSPDKIKRALVEIHERNQITTAVMDMSRGEDIAAWIESELGVEDVIDHNTANAHAASDYERFMDALRTGRLHWTAGDVDLSRHVLNAVAKVLPQGDARFMRPVESRAASMQDTRVIDGLVAAAMVHSEAVWTFQEGQTVYRGRGMVIV